MEGRDIGVVGKSCRARRVSRDEERGQRVRNRRPARSAFLAAHHLLLHLLLRAIRVVGPGKRLRRACGGPETMTRARCLTSKPPSEAGLPATLPANIGQHWPSPSSSVPASSGSNAIRYGRPRAPRGPHEPHAGTLRQREDRGDETGAIERPLGVRRLMIAHTSSRVTSPLSQQPLAQTNIRRHQ